LKKLQRKYLEPIDIADGLKKMYDIKCAVTTQLSLRKIAENIESKKNIN